MTEQDRVNIAWNQFVQETDEACIICPIVKNCAIVVYKTGYPIGDGKVKE